MSGSASTGSTSPAKKRSTLKFSLERIIGNGSFGTVFEAKIIETGETVAIKKVLQDRRFKNRELQIMKTLHHGNVVQLKHCFFTTEDDPNELYLNLVLEFIPETAYSVLRSYTRAKKHMPLLVTKLYIYQLCRALAYIHSVGVCHRDIKPQNLLCNPRTHVLKLCDFGSAKMLVPGEPNVPYICSRYYRAPELIYEASEYNCSIDVWSAGCMLGELLLGHPLFPGETSSDQIEQIARIMGPPSERELVAMNPSYKRITLAPHDATPWRRVFRSFPHVTEEATDLLSKMLQYSPDARITSLQALTHPFFDELRLADTKLPNGDPLPTLFDFSPKELASAPHFAGKLIPPHARDSDNWPPGLYDAAPVSPAPVPKTLPPIMSAASRPGTSALRSVGGGSGGSGAPAP